MLSNFSRKFEEKVRNMCLFGLGGGEGRSPPKLANLLKLSR